MKYAEYAYRFDLVFKEYNVGEAVNHGRSKLLVNATVGIGSLRDGCEKTANRSPKAIAEISGDVVVVGDRRGKIVGYKWVITPRSSH